MALLTVKNVSAWLQVKPATVYAWAEQGTIPHLKLGHLLRFAPDEIKAWLQDHRREGIPEPTTRRRRRGTDDVDTLIARAKAEVYDLSHGKLQQDRATRKGEHRGTV